MTRSKNKRKKSRASAFVEKNESLLLEKINDLLEKAEVAVDTFNYDEAEAQLKEVLEIQPDNVKSLEMLSGILIEKMQWKEAKSLLKRCIELEPETGFRKFFSMGQLSDGLESVQFYEKGILVLEKELENSENIEPSKKSSKGLNKRSLSEAYCSIAETFMTDCCDEEDAEERCRSAIDLAIRSDPSNSEAYRCFADFHLVKGDIELAKEAAQKSLSLWLPNLETLTEESYSQDVEKEDAGPSYDSRIETSKLLIELEMYYEASNVLEGLLDEDDEVIQVWYLLGWLNYIREGEEFKGNAHFYLKKAKELSDRLGVKDDCVRHIKELLEELSQTHPISDDELENDDNKSDLSVESDNEEMET